MSGNESTYKLLTGEGGYRQAIDTVLELAVSEIAIFDYDLAALRLEEPPRTAKLANFLQKDAASRLRIVVHEPHLLNSRMPRFMQLATRHSSAIQVRQRPDNLRHLADSHVLADIRHGVRRFHIDHARCALMLDDPAAIQPWRQRFEELWDLSQPCLKINTTGL
ncbi:MAG: hypothetical protein WAX67_06380 [Rugosibacter sp.]